MGAFLRATNRLWHWHTQKLLPKPFKYHSLKNCWNYLSWKAHFAKLPKWGFKFNRHLKDIPILGNWFLQKQRPWALRGCHDISKLKWTIKLVQNGLTSLLLIIQREYTTSFVGLSYSFSHLCSSCSWPLLHVDVCLSAQYVSVHCLHLPPAATRAEDGGWRGA